MIQKYTDNGKIISCSIVSDMVMMKRNIIGQIKNEADMDSYYKIMNKNFHKTEVGLDLYVGENCV